MIKDECSIAQEIAEALPDAGADTLGAAARVADALRMIASAGRMGGALLDTGVFNEAAWPVVDALPARGMLVPANGCNPGVIPTAYAHQTPATRHGIARALAQVLKAAPAR